MPPAESSDAPFLLCDGNNSSDNYNSKVTAMKVQIGLISLMKLSQGQQILNLSKK